MTDATKRALADSLRNLLLEKPLPKVTIGEVSTGAGVNRQTFYYHFRDIVDLLLYSSSLIGDYLCSDTNFGFDFENDFSLILNYLKTNERVVSNVYPFLEKEAAEILFDSVTRPFIDHYVRKASSGLDIREDDIKHVSNFYGHALKGVVYDYVSGRFAMNILDTSHRTSMMVMGSLRNSLINLVNDRLTK